jgi:hypothetical protein
MTRGPDHITETEFYSLWLQTKEENRPKLSPKQQQLVDRWDLAANILREYPAESKALPMYREACKRQLGLEMSERTARRDFDSARRVWGTRQGYDREFLRTTLLDIALSGIAKCFAMQRPDWAEKFIARAQSLSGLNSPEVDVPLFADLLRPVAVQPTFLPEMIGAVLIPEGERQALLAKLLAPKHGSNANSGIADADFEIMPPDAAEGA